jgi:hypothetical protein
MNPAPGSDALWLLRLKPPSSPDGSEPARPGTAEGFPAPGSGASGGEKALPADTLGLALAGGGLRGAAFCLGVLQALSRGGWLQRVDFLSTVSGGSSVGAFLGRFFDLCDKPSGLTGAVPNRSPGAAQERVARDLRDAGSAPVSWLRRHANYLAPSGHGEALAGASGFWRNLLAIYLVLAVLFFAAFGVLNAVSYFGWDRAAPSLAGEFFSDLTPITGRLPAPWAGPWLALAELAFWLSVVPLMAAYWLVSQDLPEAFVAPALAAGAILAVGLLVATASPLSLVILAAATLWAISVWAAVRRTEGYADPFNPARLMLARNYLNLRLGFWAGAAAVLAGLGLVDALGRWLAGLMLEGGLTPRHVVSWFVALVAALLVLAAVLRAAVRFFVARQPVVGALLTSPASRLWAVLALALGALPPLVALSFTSHAAFELGEAYAQGLWFTAGAVLVSLLFGSRACVPFVNRSSPLTVYAGRLARTFLGAVNPQRRLHPEGLDVTRAVAGDDVPFRDYRPHTAGGPLHLINCSVIETVDVASRRGLRDRPAENLSVGPVGVSVAQRWHAFWSDEPTAVLQLAPLGAAGVPHPLVGRAGGPVAVEPLGLGEWVAISGASLGPSTTRTAGSARALFLTLANLRLGYWWNSGLAAAEREGSPLKGGVWRVVTGALAHLFRAQALLLAELAGRFGGPWHRYWYLSDGGNFELTGAYELLRRRVPFVIACDAGRGHDPQGSDLARLVRLARVDFGAEVQEVGADPAALQALGLPAEVSRHLGATSDLSPRDGGPAGAHAALLLVRYPAPDAGQDPWLGRRSTWLLYLRATLTGDEPADVRNYAALRPDFPDEPIRDQVLDEPQWESYRKLGEHIGGDLFV